MSLVDYAFSSDDEDDVVPEDTKREERLVVEEEEENGKPRTQPRLPNYPPSPTTIPSNHDQRSGLLSNSLQQVGAPQPSAPSVQKLPDASLLLNSPDVSLVVGTDHASRVSAAMVENASRKRDSNVMPFSSPRSKLPRGSLPHTKNVPDTVGSLLVPPQLSGRSNIVTEDMGKLFVRGRAEPSSQ